MKNIRDRFFKIIAVNIVICFYLFCATILITNVAHSSTAEDEVTKIQQAYEDIKDISGDFIQKSYIKDLKRTDMFNGRFFIKRPMKMKWEYKGENPQEVFINNDRITIYQIKEKQALSKIDLSPEIKLHKDTRQVPSAGLSKSPLCFQSTSYGEISVCGKKVIGSAQKRWADGLLQQGAVPFVINEVETFRIFRLSPDIKGIKRFIGLQRIIPELDPDTLKENIKASFEQVFEIKLVPSAPSEEETGLALKLETEKYKSQGWNFKR